MQVTAKQSLLKRLRIACTSTWSGWNLAEDKAGMPDVKHANIVSYVRNAHGTRSACVNEDAGVPLRRSERSEGERLCQCAPLADLQQDDEHYVHGPVTAPQWMQARTLWM